MPGNNRIVFVANTSWSIYRFRLFVIKQLIQSGYSIYILAPRDRYTQNFETIPGLQFIPLEHFDNNKVAVFKDILLYRELKKLYRSIDPALIFHYTIKANICGSLASGSRYPAIAVITGLGYAFLKNSFFQFFARTLYKFSLRFSKMVWFLNEDDKEVFIKKNLVPRSKTFVLPGEGVDTDIFLPGPSKISEKTSFLLIARLTRHKGVYEFVEAIGILKEKGLAVEGKILGRFDQESPASVSAKELEKWQDAGTISYLGETDNVIPFINEADCIVLPSYREGLPFSLLEAASMSKVIIATDTAGCRDLITDGINGYLCARHNAVSLAEKMGMFFHLSADQKKNMGESGRLKVISGFRKEIIAGIYHNKISEMLK